VCRGGDRLRSDTAKKFKIDPEHLLYSLRWLLKGTPPDFQLSLVQHHPEQWINTAPEAIDWERLTAAGIVSQLDAFEAAMDSRIARRH
jgi:hypothetical protein